jgi:hypothetical protein
VAVEPESFWQPAVPVDRAAQRFWQIAAWLARDNEYAPVDGDFTPPPAPRVRLGDAQIDPKIIVHPSQSRFWDQPPATQLAQNQFPGLKLLPIEWPQLKIKPIPTVWSNLKMKPIGGSSPTIVNSSEK